MQIVRGLHNLRPEHRGSALTIGNYDGVHRGHQAVLATLRARAQALGAAVTVVTFEPTPQEYFGGSSAPSRLMRLRDKLLVLAEHGVRRVLCLRFDRVLAGLSAGEFVERVLVRGLGARHVVVGADFRFGRGFVLRQVPELQIQDQDLHRFGFLGNDRAQQDDVV